MKPIVIDASIAVAWCVPDEATVGLRKIVDEVIECGAIVPDIWRSEVANALLMAERKSRLSLSEVDHHIREFEAMPIQSVRLDISAVLSFARQFHLTYYDACYLRLAVDRQSRLGTTDGQIREAANQIGVVLI